MNLKSIKDRVGRIKRCAERIMDGGENYDGADGAREVLDLCDICEQLILELEHHDIH